MAKKQDKIEMPMLPASCTCTVDSNSKSIFSLSPKSRPRVLYDLSGFIEFRMEDLGESRTPENTSICMIITNINLRGELINPSCENAPGNIHLKLAQRAEPVFLLNILEGAGSAKIDFEVEYDELFDFPEHVGEPHTDHFPYIIPIKIPLQVSFGFTYRSGENKLLLSTSGVIPEFPPYTGSPTPISLFTVGDCEDKIRCLELCLSIKIATRPDGTPILTTQKVREFVRDLNSIWDCQPPAQCCISFRIKEILAPMDPRIAESYKFNGYIGPWDYVFNINRSRECYNIVFMEEIQGAPTGITGFGSLSGSVVETNGRSDAAIGQTLAHEIGHALDLANGSGADADGVSDHSTKDKNLMNPTAGEDKRDLNSRQCAKARRSRMLKSTSGVCVQSPNET